MENKFKNLFVVVERQLEDDNVDVFVFEKYEDALQAVIDDAIEYGEEYEESDIRRHLEDYGNFNGDYYHWCIKVPCVH